MKRILLIVLMVSISLLLTLCEKEAEISPERLQILADTVAQELEYEPWMDFAYELAKNYPQEYAAGMALVQSAERSILEQDDDRFVKLFDLLKNYPEDGALEMTDQIAFGNRLAWIMSDQMFLFNRAHEVMTFTIEKFKDEEQNLKWRDELGAMIYDTEANVLEKMNEPEKALKSYSTSLEYMEQPETLLRRGLILETQNDLEGALEDFVTALGLAPNQSMILNKVKEVFIKLNPNEDPLVFINDLQESLFERRKEEVLSEAFFNDAPEFKFTTLKGKTMDNASSLGKVVFVDFWATWCNPCRRELPEFQAFYERYKDNPRVVFVAASTDREKEKVVPYIEEMKYTFPVAYAEDNATKFGVEGIPCLFIIGPEGKIRYKIVGFDPDKDFVREMGWRLESLLDS